MTKKNPPILEVYQDRSGQYRWRLKAKNGKIVADGSESYTRRRDVVRAAKAAAWLFIDAEFNISGLPVLGTRAVP